MVWEGDCDNVRVTLLQVREELFVDTSRGEKLRINFDIDFPRMPCLCESCDLASLTSLLAPTSCCHLSQI